MKSVTRFSSLFATIATLATRLGRVFPANVSPLGSLGFFSANPLWLIVAVVGFDLIKGGWYPGFVWTYLGFASYWLLGRLNRNRLSRQVILLPVASLLFFLLSNFGVWWHWYDHNIEGLVRCYTLAIPFYRATLIGDLIFGYGFLISKHLFASWNTVESRYVTLLSPTKNH